MQRIGVGIIGWGFMGKTHAYALRALPLMYPGIDFEPQLEHVCTRRIEQAKAAAEAIGFGRYSDDYMAVINDPNVQVVSICTPNESHCEIAVAAARNKKHLYIDKPLALNAKEAELIASAVSENNVYAQLAYNNRYLPAIMRMKQLLDEGALGEVLTFSVRYLHSGSIDPSRPMGWKQGLQGGVLLDLGSHVLDLLTWLIGYPKSGICATNTLYAQRPTKIGTTETNLSEDHALITLRMPNGALGTVEASKISSGAVDDMSIEIRGKSGAVFYNSMEPSFVSFYDNTQPEVALGGMRGMTKIETVGRYPAPGGAFFPSKNAIGWERGHIHCYYSFLDCIAHGRSPSGDVFEALRLQRLMDALAEAGKSGLWTDLSNI